MTPWIVAHQAPLSMGFLRQEYWSGLPFPSPGDLPKPGIKPRSPQLQADSLPSEPQGKPLTSKAYSKSKTFGSEQWLWSYGCTHTHLNTHTYTYTNFLEELVRGLSYRYRNLKQVQGKITQLPRFCLACGQKACGLCPTYFWGRTFWTLWSSGALYMHTSKRFW